MDPAFLWGNAGSVKQSCLMVCCVQKPHNFFIGLLGTYRAIAVAYVSFLTYVLGNPRAIGKANLLTSAALDDHRPSSFLLLGLGASGFEDVLLCRRTWFPPAEAFLLWERHIPGRVGFPTLGCSRMARRSSDVRLCSCYTASTTLLVKLLRAMNFPPYVLPLI